MSFASKHNKGSKFDIFLDGIDDFHFKTMKEMVDENGYETVYQIAALYINTKGIYDDHPVVVIPEYKALVDLPPHMTKEVKEIISDDEDCEAINNGLVGIKFEEYVSKKHNRKCIGVKWLDL